MNKIYKKAISVISLLAVFYMPLPSGPSAAQAALEGQDSQSRGYIVQFIDEPLIARWQEPQAFLANSQTKSYRQRLDDNFSAHKFSLEQLVTNLNSENIQEFKNVFSGVYLNISDEEAEKIKKLDFVKSVYPNYRVEASLMDSVSQIGAAEVWNSGYTGEGVTIAIIDTGIDYTHPDFAGKVIGGYDFVHNDSDPMDDHGHGTHVAGIAAGNGALKGVAPDADLLAYKVLNSQGSGWSNKIISAIERAVDPNQDGDFSDKADIISMSFGGGGNPDDPMSTAVDNAVKAGVVAVAAAGNSGPSSATITSPGTAREAITVGAVDKNDNIAFFSSRGPVKWGGEILVKPDIVAPGVGICSAQWDSAWNNSKCFDDDHVSLSGTSMATPHVAGAAALLLQKNPDWNPEEVKMALRSGADNLGFDINAQGYGRLNILNAVGLSEIPSIAKINTSGTVSGKIDIVGTAGGKFSHYALYYGGGDNPDDWQKITEGANQINNDILYRGFDTALLSEGNNFFRLVVWNQNGEPSEDRSMVIVDNIKINKPFNNDIYRAGELLEITGTILGSGNGFTVDYGLRERPTEWSSEGITLTNGGTGDIANGVIAAWDTSSIVKSDFYTIRVNINYPNGETSPEYAKNIYFDATLKQGWPVRLDLKTSSCPFGTSEFYTLIDPSSKNQNQEASPKTLTKDELLALSGNDNHANGGGGCHYWLGMLEPVVADIDNDGLSEIVVFEGGAPPEIKVFKPDGSLFWSALIGQGEVLGGNLTVPLVGDINNDGYKEIIAHNNNINDGYSELSAFDHNGSLLWSTRVAKDYQPTMLIADLDLDGNNEIVVKGNDSNDRQMVIINHLGEIISQWSLPHITWSASIVSTPAVGNFDDDPDLEIVSAGPSENAGYDFENKKWINEGVIYVYNMDGSVVPGWPVYTNGVIWSSPAVGDINRDGENEIVIGVMAGADTHRPDLINGGVYAFDEKGKVLPGWPVEKGWDFWSSPSLADFDGNGDLEIAISRLGFSTYVIHNDGKIASGWPQFTGWNDYYSTIVGDINNDGIPDVLTTAGSAVVGGGVYAWNFDGNPIEGFPKFTEADAQAPATIADIDNDGKLELVASSDWDYDFINKKYKLRETIYVWELEGNLNQEKMAWPMFHLDSQHSGFYQKNYPGAVLFKGIKDHYLDFYGDGKYDPVFDLNEDEIINILDFTLLAAHINDEAWCSARLKNIKVVSPNGGEEWGAGNTYDITWNSAGVDRVNIGLQNGENIVLNLPASQGKYSWTIPPDKSSNAEKITIWENAKAGVQDESDNYFSIVAASATQVGSLSIALATDNPAAQSVVAGSKDINFLKVNLTASAAEDVFITSLKVYAYKNGGIESARKTDISNVALYDGNARITTKKQISSNGLVIFSSSDFISANGITIPRGTSRTLTVKDDIPSTTAVTALQLALSGGNDLVANGVTSGVSITTIDSAMGSVMNVVPAGSLNISLNSGTPASQSVVRGTSNVEFLRANFIASNEDIYVKSIKITRGGVASDGDLGAIKLYDGATLLGTAYLVSHKAEFNFPAGDYITVVKGTIKVLTVKADISPTATVGDMVVLAIASSGDVTAIGVNSATVINPTGNATGNNMTIIGAASSITVTFPNSGGELIKGNTYDITWTSAKVEKINIEAVTPEQNLGQVASNIDAQSGKYSWQIPLADFGGGFSLNAVKIRISDADNATVSDESDDYFSIIKSSSPPPPPPPPPPTTACASLQDGIKERYLSFYGDGRYDPVFDLNKDNKINVLDISLFAMHSDEETWCSLALQ